MEDQPGRKPFPLQLILGCLAVSLIAWWGVANREYLLNELFLDKLLVAAQYPFLLTIFSMPLALIFGLALAMLRMSRSRWLSWPAAFYIELVRGTPLLVQMFLVFYSLPLLGLALDVSFLTLDPFPAAVLCLAGNYAAYEAEIHRAGLEAVDKGQREAALSIGMSEQQAFLRIVLPQAFRVVVPPVINDMIAMLKDSCVASVIGVPELLNKAQAIARSNLKHEQMYIAAAILYMVLSLACYAFGKWVERRLKSSGAPELHVEQAHGH